MKSADIEEKIAELESLMTEYKIKLNSLEKELNKSISNYRKTLEEKRLKQIRSSF